MSERSPTGPPTSISINLHLDFDFYFGGEFNSVEEGPIRLSGEYGYDDFSGIIYLSQTVSGARWVEVLYSGEIVLVWAEMVDPS